MTGYGIKTWKSIAFPGILFISLAGFLFADAVQQKLDLSSSIKESARIYVMSAEDGAQDAFTQVASELGEMGAENGSYVYDIDTNVQTQSVDKEIGVRGIQAAMIEGTVICGEYYSDESSRLSVVINIPMLATLSDIELKEQQPEVKQEAAKWIGHSIIIGKSAARISGVVDDNSDSQAACISIPAAENFIKNQGETPKASSYCVKISDLKSITKIQDKLGENGVSTTIDEKSLTEWKLKSAGITSRIIMGCIAIAAAVCMILLSARLVSYRESPKPKMVHFARVCTVFVIGIIAGVMVDRLVICLFSA